MKQQILIVGSRSGGHILPGLTVGKQLHEQGHSIVFVAESRPLDRALVAHETWLTHQVFLNLVAPAVRRFWLYPWYAWLFMRQVIAIIQLLRTHRINRVIGMGGYSSVPVCCAAWLCKIPYELYELNAELGRAVALLQYGARTVACCFPEALHAVRPGAQKLVEYPLRVLPTPIRYTSHIDKSICSALRASGGVAARTACPADVSTVALAKEEALERRGKCFSQHSGFNLLVLGGSQGSQSLSKLVIDWVATLPSLQRTHLFIMHQTGSSQELIHTQYTHLGVTADVFNYRDDLTALYQHAHLIITRAGSGVLHEIMQANKPALIIPLEVTTTRHQVANARAVERRNPQHWVMIRQHQVDQLHQYLSAQLAKAQVNYAEQLEEPHLS